MIQVLVRHTEEEYENAIRLHEKGAKYSVISNILEVPPSTIRSWCVLGVKPIDAWTENELEGLSEKMRKPKHSPEWIEKLRASKLGPLNIAWKGDDVNLDAGRQRAQHRFYAPKGYVRHHIDGDPLNNDPSNIQIMLKGDHDSLNAHEKPRDEKGRFTKYSLAEEAGV